MNHFRFSEFDSERTLFVLGCGPSINRMSQTQWEVVNSNVSVAFNNFCVHEFIPSIYMLENTRNDQSAADICYNMGLRAEYRDIPIFLRVGGTSRPFRFGGLSKLGLNRLYCGSFIDLPGVNFDELEKSCSSASELGWFDESSHYNIGVSKRATIDRVLHWAVVGGFRQIVLCGIDLNVGGYFFDENWSHYGDRGFVYPSGSTKLQSGSVHNTFRSDGVAMPIDQVIMTYKRCILDPRGVSLYVGSSSSALSDNLPVYSW